MQALHGKHRLYESRRARPFGGSRSIHRLRVVQGVAGPRMQLNATATPGDSDGWQAAREAAARGLALLLAGAQVTMTALALQASVAIGPAQAVLSSPNAKVPRTVDAALRRWMGPQRWRAAAPTTPSAATRMLQLTLTD